MSSPQQNITEGIKTSYDAMHIAFAQTGIDKSLGLPDLTKFEDQIRAVTDFILQQGASGIGLEPIFTPVGLPHAELRELIGAPASIQHTPLAFAENTSVAERVHRTRGYPYWNLAAISTAESPETIRKYNQSDQLEAILYGAFLRRRLGSAKLTHGPTLAEYAASQVTRAIKDEPILDVVEPTTDSGWIKINKPGPHLNNDGTWGSIIARVVKNDAGTLLLEVSEQPVDKLEGLGLRPTASIDVNLWLALPRTVIYREDLEAANRNGS